MDMDAVTRILHEAVNTEILPRFRSLSKGDVVEKSPGEIVTVADRRAEEFIARGLCAVVDAPVVGEEATAADPRLLAAVGEADAAWLVDPIDGTAHFVDGTEAFAVMAALVRRGETVASWIVQPMLGHTYVAEMGSGAWRDDTRLRLSPAPQDVTQLRGDVLTRFLSPRQQQQTDAAAPNFADLGPGTKCAGIDYPRLANGERDFIRFQRILPWDHAPGALLLDEAGGFVGRLDGSAYRPGDDRPGLLAAADERTFATVSRLVPHA